METEEFSETLLSFPTLTLLNAHPTELSGKSEGVRLTSGGICEKRDFTYK
jgi:hypothetical protein